ncbi:MAG: 2-C-methyl-D-erythritol 4-phosphate cytidylyltransferase [Sedimentisphaerales bacterium]|nr:2-C-methyl-D-erythritol 4-phosphate cytidylyltransferase [Sedimentisphaerales bacterium]
MAKKVGVIICAAGASRRFGDRRKKPFVDVAGRAVFLRSVELFTNRDDVKQILLAISSEDKELVDVKWGANLKFFNVKTCIGGSERFETVNNALALIKNDIDLIAVHDAVRCCVTEKWVDEVIAAAARTGAAILACPVVATLKDVKDSIIVKTVDRNDLYEAQTPQVFETELLKKAYDSLNNDPAKKISDDAQLMENLGHMVTIVETDSSNIKITYPNDIAVAEAILKSRPKTKPQGYAGPYAEAQW